MSTGWDKNIGHKLIKSCTMYIGNTPIDHIDSNCEKCKNSEVHVHKVDDKSVLSMGFEKDEEKK